MSLLDWSSQILEIPDMSGRLDLRPNIWILLENILEQELLCQCKAFDRHINHINELTSTVVDNIVITKYELMNEFSHSLKFIFGGVSQIKEVANRYHTLKTEVHLWDFILININDLIVGIDRWVEVPWQESI